MADEIRVYAVIHADFTAGSVSDAQWQALINATKLQNLSAAILNAAQGRGAQAYITASKRSQNALFLNLYTMLGFEVDRTQAGVLTTILDTEATTHSVTGNNQTKFEGVLQAEIQAAALGLGYSAANAAKLTVTLLNGAIANTFKRDVAIQQAQDYLAANAAIWYE